MRGGVDQNKTPLMQPRHERLHGPDLGAARAGCESLPAHGVMPVEDFFKGHVAPVVRAAPRHERAQMAQGVLHGLRREMTRAKMLSVRFKVQGSRFKVQGSGFRVQGSGFSFFHPSSLILSAMAVLLRCGLARVRLRVDLLQLTTRDVQVTLRGGEVLVAEQLLDVPRVGSALQHGGREHVAERVRAERAPDARKLHMLRKLLVPAVLVQGLREAIEEQPELMVCS